MTTMPINLLSDKQLAEISSGKQWSFHGGVHPQENKHQSSHHPIEDAGIPEFLVIAVEHKGYLPELLVKVGDPVLKGQPLTKVYGAMVVQHASSSGVVHAIEQRTDLHPSGLPVTSIVIATDGLDRSITYNKCEDYTTQANAQIIEKIQQAGIVGLGGAGFPTHLKLFHTNGIKLLIINAVECEPYITADDRLMQEHSDEIITGVQILQHLLKPELTIIAVEDNKPEAIAALHLSLQKLDSEQASEISIRSIMTCYPSGSEKQLIEIITGQQTPYGRHPTELGIVMQNVGTVFAIKEAIVDGKPLLSRIVTITGEAFAEKGNLSVRIGTPIQHLLDRNKLDTQKAQKLIIGGPMMGFSISHGDIPVTKTCNCILAPSKIELPEPANERACIRCGECAEVCPATLLPQQLFWYAQSKDHEKAQQYNLSSCIECGACAFVCPSHIPLVEYYRVAKAEIKSAKEEAKKTEIARIRFQKREARLEQAKLERQAKHKQAAEKRQQQMKENNGGEDLVAAALARAKAKKQEQADNQQVPSGDSKKEAVAAAIARAKAKKQEQTDNPPVASGDNKKDAIAAAIARAKAKKAQQADQQKAPSGDDKKDAMAAAVAHAKAKKQEQADSQPASSGDSKKDAVAAAIARAKAKKAEKVQDKSEQDAIAENQQAIQARQQRKEQARLHKQQKQHAQPNSEQEKNAEASSDDPRKMKIAAAIARAKAKKAAQEDL